MVGAAWGRSTSGAKAWWRGLPEGTRRWTTIAVEVVVAVALWLWIRPLGWGVAYIAGTLWTLKVRDELFWGFDATELALAYRDDEGALDAEMRRVDAIPEAVQRRKPGIEAAR